MDGDLIFEQGNLVFEDETTMSTVPPGSPVGSIMLFAGTVAPDGWFLCDGEAVSRTEYSQLFDVFYCFDFQDRSTAETSDIAKSHHTRTLVEKKKDFTKPTLGGGGKGVQHFMISFTKFSFFNDGFP